MKCERCGSDLSGTSILCPKCKHNNARQVVNNWRSNQVAGKGSPKAATATVPRIKPRGDADANLIRFPAGNATVSDSSAVEAGDWRSQVKEKVRQARMKRHVEEEPDRHEERNLEQNPIVQAALNRIKWSTQTTTPTVRPSYGSGRGAAALAEALDPLPVVESLVDPQPAVVKDPAPRPTSRNNPFLYTTHRIERAEPKAEIPLKAAPKPEPKPEPKPDLISYADAPKARPATVVPPLVPPPVLPAPRVAAAPAPRIEEKREVVEKIPIPPEPEKKLEPTVPIVKSESKGTQVIEIPSIISHMYEIVPAPATLWVRSLAAGCDLEIMAMAFLPIFAAYATLNTSLGSEALFILGVLLSSLVFVYQAVCLQIAERTFGMALLNLRLINTGDENMPITRQQKMLRAWGATIAFLFPPLNLIIIKANRRGLSLPDLISGTSPVEGR
ncbi:MAG: RDD family protein [Acidobacteriota bacterium]|nr:MAG: RDD family protein [Acidobacteriota bacterium]